MASQTKKLGVVTLETNRKHEKGSCLQSAHSAAQAPLLRSDANPCVGGLNLNYALLENWNGLARLWNLLSATPTSARKCDSTLRNRAKSARVLPSRKKGLRHGSQNQNLDTSRPNSRTLSQNIGIITALDQETCFER